MIILHIEMSMVNLNNLCEKAKHTRERPTQDWGSTFVTTEMAVALDTDYSCETGYPFDDSRQIGNTSYFENGIV